MLNSKLNWEDHINNFITKANKRMGLMWKINREVPRYAVELIFTSFIRPQLEYSTRVMSETSSTSLHWSLSANKHRCTTERARMAQIRKSQKLLQMILFYKMNHGHTPTYLRELVPPRHGQIYQTRRNLTFTTITTNTEIFHRSLLHTYYAIMIAAGVCSK